MRNIGLAGCSGVGKSTLAAYFQHQMIESVGYCPSVASSVFQKYGYSQSDHLMPEERLYLQEKILDAQIEEYERCERMHGSFIADRTPIDMATFTMLNINTPEFRLGQAYTTRCVAVTKKFFKEGVFVIPPLIPYKDDGTRPPYSAEGIEKYRGKMAYIMKERNVPHVMMPDIIDLKQRFDWLRSEVYPVTGTGEINERTDAIRK